ncbi:hypothetical protein [Streptomyces mirabilis]|uniref:hypothetical protein n=1 Tax=Streptomyces mirabilis TaxID=68239 RepID=UPI00167DA083|nr:hypothetical protein [Streptomyces mirabilis]
MSLPQSATPHTSRPVAAALTVLAWTLLSAFALRGLSLRCRVAYPARAAGPAAARSGRRRLQRPR